jgi:alditol oxidase
MTTALTNWAGNISYAAKAVHTPATLDELKAIVVKSRKLRALGSRHSFNTIADTDADLVAMRGFNNVISIDSAARTATIEGGIAYGELCPILDAAGFAIHNLASLPHISVAGAAATATHGSGDRNGNLATAISGLKIMTADGEIRTLRRGDAAFDGAVVNLGALGIVTEITIELLPRFEARQHLYLDLPVADALASFDELTSSAYSVSLFTLWQGDTIAQVWLKSLADAPPRLDAVRTARPATRTLHPIAAIDATPCTEQMGVAGAWYRRLPHFKMEFTPSAGAELQTEYFVARADAVAAFKALYAMQHKIAPLLLVSEIRTMSADSLWMSMANGRDSVAFHFTWKPDWPAVRAVLPEIEAALSPFSARPHWGKLFAMPKAKVQALTPRLSDFRALCGQYDPTGKFRNAFVEEFVF